MTDEERRELEDLRAELSAMEEGLRHLGERLRTLERAAGPGAEAAPPPPSGPAAAASRRPRLRPPSPSRVPPRLLGGVRAFFTEGNPLNKLGALSLVVGAAIVFKYAVDNGWIGPTGRVVLGLAVGAALLGAGEVYARRGWRTFASGLVAAGDGLLFVSVWFGQQQYGVIPAPLAFGLYVVVTAAVVAQALRTDALGLAVWGLLGGYLAPALASTGSGNFAFLSSYLLVLDGGVFAIAYRRNWQPLKWMAFLLTLVYTGGWVREFVEHPGDTRWLELHWLLPYLAAFFVSFAAIPTWRSLRLREPIDAFGQVLTVANGVAHFLFTALALHDHPRAWLGLVAAVAAVVYAAVSSRVARQPVLDARGLRIFTGTAAGFLLLATPYLVSGPLITLVWCAQTVLLAWGCTRPRFAFLQLHVLAMLGVILVRLVGYDGLFESRWGTGGERYLPLAQLRSWPPFAAALTFAAAARLLARVPQVRLPAGWLLGAGLVVLVAAVDGEAGRAARHLFAPLGSRDLQELVRAGLLVALMVGLWMGVTANLGAAVLPWGTGLLLAATLIFWTFQVLVWPGGFVHLLRIVGDGHALWWLHGGVLLLAPLLLLLGWLGREAPERALGMTRERIQALLFVTALAIAMLLLRREAFAITHAPPFADLLPDGARRAGYRTILSLSYALLAFGVYTAAIRRGQRALLRAAYGLYLFTALKVYLFDLEAQNQLYRAFSLLFFAAILFVSSYFANRQHRSQHA
jgi:uncharacterized membrane protein